MFHGIEKELRMLNNNLRFLIKVLNEKLPGPPVEAYAPERDSDLEFPFSPASSKRKIPDAMPTRGPKP